MRKPSKLLDISFITIFCALVFASDANLEPWSFTKEGNRYIGGTGNVTLDGKAARALALAYQDFVSDGDQKTTDSDHFDFNIGWFGNPPEPRVQIVYDESELGDSWDLTRIARHGTPTEYSFDTSATMITHKRRM